jgi:hypothetical protein
VAVAGCEGRVSLVWIFIISLQNMLLDVAVKWPCDSMWGI